MTKNDFFGISAAITIPFDGQGNIDHHRLIKHARRLLESRCASITLFGTTGEGTAISHCERGLVIERLIEAQIPSYKIIVGVASCSVGDAVAQAIQGLEIRCQALLVAPPFYYKSVTDDGLFDWFSRFIGQLGSDCPELILYHIPQVTGVPLSISLIKRLKEKYPDIIYGVKDSSGNWKNSNALLKLDNLAILIGDERHLAKAAKLGATGAISGLANILANELSHIIESRVENKEVNGLVDAVVKLPVTAAIKALVAEKYRDPVWNNMCAPLSPLQLKEAGQLQQYYRKMFPSLQDQARAG